MALDDQSGCCEGDPTVRNAVDAVVAFLAAADLERLQSNTTHMTERVLQAIKSAESVAAKSVAATATSRFLDDKPRWVPPGGFPDGSMDAASI